MFNDIVANENNGMITETGNHITLNNSKDFVNMQNSTLSGHKEVFDDDITNGNRE